MKLKQFWEAYGEIWPECQKCKLPAVVVADEENRCWVHGGIGNEKYEWLYMSKQA